MMAFSTLRMTGRQRDALRDHLFPGDGKEAVAVGLCGRHQAASLDAYCVHRLVFIPHDECSVRTADRVTWPTDRLRELLPDAIRRGLAVVKFHSHPTGYPKFSETDDASDAELFASVHGWTDGVEPHLSAVMLPDSRMFARVIHLDGRFSSIDRVAVAGDDIQFFDAGDDHLQEALPAEQDRHARFFGEATTRLMGRLAVAVVGCSGTGGPTVEMLARLGVDRLLLVDPDVVGPENLNRIPNTFREDADDGMLKVEAIARAVRRMGLGTTVQTLADNIAESAPAVRALAGVDVLFGCMDSAEGRHVLNQIATFYSLPYFDVGVKLEVDTDGGIEEVCGAVHYITPDGSSLLDRGLYTMDRVIAEGTRRRDPEQYAQLREEGYIRGAVEHRPAVVSINTLFAARAVNEFLARLHPYRLEPNGTYAEYRESLAQMEVYSKADVSKADDPVRIKTLGRGDSLPLLQMPQFTDAGAR